MQNKLTLVKKSPLSERRQRTWTDLHKKKVITAQELVETLGKGKIGELTTAEMRAFEELAPVYEPERRKRLKYEVRQKHIAVELIRSSREWRAVMAARCQRGGAEATTLGWKTGRRDGSVPEMMPLDIATGDIPLCIIPHNVNAARAIKADAALPLGELGLDLTGEGVGARIYAFGMFLRDHQEFAGERVLAPESLGPEPSGHATQVAGTFGAHGVESDARGTAPNSLLSVRPVTEPLGPLSEEETPVLSQVQSLFAFGSMAGWHNATYGGVTYWWDAIGETNGTESTAFGKYTSDSALWDGRMYQGQYIGIPVVSAGNERYEEPGGWHFCTIHGGAQTNDYHPADGSADGGYDTLTSFSVAKNFLVVGGAWREAQGGITNIVLAPYSSCGPCDDGRIKPDVVGYGGDVYTTSKDATNEYTISKGTSHAAASVCGALALLEELHVRMFGTKRPLLSSTQKALLIHTAEDAGAVGPDYCFGWGMVDVRAAVAVYTNNVAPNDLPHVKEVALLEDESIEFDVVPDGVGPLTVTLAWTDPAGEAQPAGLDQTNSVLCNDVDLRVIGKDSSLACYPWILNPSAPSQAAQTGDNWRDNVEQVHITNATESGYTVRISHKGDLVDGIQDVSIIITGNERSPTQPFDVSSFGRTSAVHEALIQWPAVVGGWYDIEKCANLSEDGGDWTNDLTASANVTNMLRELVISDPPTFYRIRRTR